MEREKSIEEDIFEEIKNRISDFNDMDRMVIMSRLSGIIQAEVDVLASQVLAPEILNMVMKSYEPVFPWNKIKEIE